MASIYSMIKKMGPGLIIGAALACTATLCPPVAGAMMGGGGMHDNSGSDLTEADCRSCHENLARFPMLEVDNPDKHHLLVGLEILASTVAINGIPGQSYECLSCHIFEWSPELMGNIFVPFRDCLSCHPLNTVSGRGITNLHHRTATAQLRNCRVCHGFFM